MNAITNFLKENWKSILAGVLGFGAITAIGVGIYEADKPVTSEGIVQTVSWERTIYIQKRETVKKSGWNVPKGGRVYDTSWEFKEFINVPSGKDQNGNTTYKQEAKYATKYYYEVDEWNNDREITTNAISDKRGDIVGPYWGEIGELSDDERIGRQEEAFYICIVDRETKAIKEFEVSDYEWRNVARGDYVRVSHSKHSRVGKSVEVLG